MPGAKVTEPAPPSGQAPGENQLGGGGGELNILPRAQWRETYQAGEGAPAYTAAGRQQNQPSTPGRGRAGRKQSASDAHTRTSSSHS